MNGLSPTEYAKKMRVERSTVYRWLNNGKLEWYETPGGLKRITGIKELLK